MEPSNDFPCHPDPSRSAVLGQPSSVALRLRYLRVRYLRVRYLRVRYLRVRYLRVRWPRLRPL